MKVDVKHFGFYNFLQDFISSNIHRDFNNIFHEFKILKKVIRTKTVTVDFHNKFIKF